MVLHNFSTKVFETLSFPTFWISEAEVGAVTVVAVEQRASVSASRARTVEEGAGYQAGPQERVEEQEMKGRRSKGKGEDCVA